MEFKTEKDLHKACVKWIRSAYPHAFIYHAPAEAKRSFKTVSVLHSFGFVSGCPDLLIFNMHPKYSGLAIELKNGKNTTTDNQNRFINCLTVCGWRCYVCNTIDQFMHCVTLYMDGIE